MLDKFLKEVVIVVVGKQAETIVPLLNSTKHVNEFIIAKKMDLTINQTRNILYRLADNGLVSSIRKKDKKKGWYTYFWKIEILKCLEFLKGLLDKKVNQFQAQINSREIKQFYICERCNVEFNEENALLKDFTCSECGGVFNLKDNSKLLKELGRNLEKINKELELIESEIIKEKEKLEKVKFKEIREDEKIKAEKKLEASEKRKKAREATKKLGVVSTKKKVKEKKKILKKSSTKNKIVKNDKSKKSSLSTKKIRSKK